MSVSVYFCDSTVNIYLQKNDYLSLAEHIKNTFKIQRDGTGAPIKFEFCEDNTDALNNLLTLITSSKLDEKYNDLLKEVFRALRNCVLNPQFQNYLVNNKNFLNNVKSVIDIVLGKKLDNSFMQVILQFLINVTICNKAAAYIIYDQFLITVLSFLKQNICIYESSALLYNFSLYKSLENFDLDLYQNIFELYENDDSIEFLHFLIETFLSYKKFWNFYNNLKITQRIFVLQIIKEFHLNSKKINLPESALIVLVKYFSDSCTIIFQTLSEDYGLSPYEVSLLLDVLASLSSDKNYLKLLQRNKDLLVISGILLMNIHQIGKQSNNCFTVAQKLSEIGENSDAIKKHPAFGFKADLIRILGNLCWKNELAQNLVREAELIPVLLDCCNLDAKNPFIMQWVIFAIRNLCEKNVENQAIIAGLHKKGTVSASVLKEVGMTLHEEDGKGIKLVPLELLKK